LTQIAPVTSEALQATIRRLLPSQVGFGEDLRATNLITPIIDLTPTAEGSILPAYLQTAASHGNITAFSVVNTTTTVISTTGFFRVLGTVVFTDTSPSQNFSGFKITDGSTPKTVWGFSIQQLSGADHLALNIDFNVFLRAGDSLTCTSNDGTIAFVGSTFQIADVSGNLTSPAGFTLE
jgi:hypothetical protein